MKKINLLYSLLAVALLGAGCEKFVEGYDVSPNSPSEVNNQILLTAVEVGTANTYSGNLARTAAVLTSQLSGRQFQFQDLNNYIIREADVQNEWEQIYRTMLNAQLLIDQAGDQNPYYRGIGQILFVLNAGVATDLWGDVPYFQALRGIQGEETFQPVYDDQEDILADMQSRLDQAIQDLSRPVADNLTFPGPDELFFANPLLDAMPNSGAEDIAPEVARRWRNAARVLKARYYNRLSERDAQNSATQALQALDAAYADGFTSNDESLFAPFGTAQVEWNQWYAFEFARAGYISADSFFVNLLEDNNDPRLSSYLAPISNDSFGYDSGIGPYLNTASAPAPIITYSEAKFIEAEAALRLGQLQRAADAFNAAVTASIDQVGITGTEAQNFLDAVADETAATINLEKIMTQKYIALFGQIEVWNDYRRTGLPAITPRAGADIDVVPRRLPTAQTERLYNANAEVVTDLTVPVWWDI